MVLGTTLMHNSYGVFGKRDTSVDRTRTNLVLNAQLNSTERQTNDITIGLSANIWSLGDTRAGRDSSISVVSPTLTASYGTNLGATRLTTGLSYLSSSLDYDHAVQSPSLIVVNASAQWELMPRWILQAGGEIENACIQLADGVIELKKKTQDSHTARFIRILKMVKTKIKEEYYPLELTSSGIVVHNKVPVTL
jgi:KaiC/GvpD/RAD55 family RecA-like ATPase